MTIPLTHWDEGGHRIIAVERSLQVEKLARDLNDLGYAFHVLPRAKSAAEDQGGEVYATDPKGVKIAFSVYRKSIDGPEHVDHIVNLAFNHYRATQKQRRNTK